MELTPSFGALLQEFQCVFQATWRLVRDIRTTELYFVRKGEDAEWPPAGSTSECRGD
jgi:hypothetical protein